VKDIERKIAHVCKKLANNKIVL